MHLSIAMKLVSLSRLRYYFLRYFPYIVFFAFILFIFLTNTVHESYPDEFDDILGGWYLLHGSPLYSGFFTHHNPFAYILSAGIEIFSGRSFFQFRFVYAIVLFVYLLWTYIFLQKRFARYDLKFYLAVILLFGIGATYFWGHMLLADNIAALLLLPVFSLLFLRIYYKEKLIFSDMVAISILSSLAFFTAATYIFLVGLVYLYSLVFYLYENKISLLSVKFVKVITVFAVPYIIFLLYLLATGALKDYYYQNIVFNPRFYIYNYPRPEGAPVNPIRYAIIIANDFYNNFFVLLMGAREFNFAFPFNMTLAVANTAMVIYLLLQRRYSLALFTILIIIYANVRTNPLTSRETDYQSSVYILLSFFNLGFILKHLYDDIDKPQQVLAKKVIFSFLILVVGIYAFFNFAFLIRKYNEKVFKKYMGIQPLIYDRPQVAPIINSITNENDYVWIGPFAFEELFYTNQKVPSKYIILLPEFAKFPQIKDEFMADFQKNKPTVMYFDKTYTIRGYIPEKYAQFFLDFLSKEYVTLAEYTEGNTKYTSAIPITDKIDLERKLYIAKDHKDEVIKKLLDQNLIKSEQVK